MAYMVSTWFDRVIVEIGVRPQAELGQGGARPQYLTKVSSEEVYFSVFTSYGFPCSKCNTENRINKKLHKTLKDLSIL